MNEEAIREWVESELASNLDVIEDQEHLLVCDGYADLHQGADLRMEPELVDFYQRVLD